MDPTIINSPTYDETTSNVNVSPKQSPEFEQYECTLCQETFISEDLLTRHYKDHMEKNLYMCVSDEESSVILDEQDIQYIIPNNIGQIVYQCEICHESFAQQNILTEHYFSHTEMHILESTSEEKRFGCSLCNKTFPLEELLKFHYSCHVKKHECDVCYKKFPFKSNLLAHYRNHVDKITHVCSVCVKSFSCEEDLKHHTTIHNEIQELHAVKDSLLCNSASSKKTSKAFSLKDKCDIGSANDNNVFKCNKCEECFDNSNKFNAHNAMHAQVKKHMCFICFKYFSKTSHLQCHLRIHTGEKPFACNFCERSFSEKGNLVKHQLRHQRDSFHNLTS